MAKDLSAHSKPDLGPFNWADPFLLNDQLRVDERMIQNSDRAYAQDKLLPRVMCAF